MASSHQKSRWAPKTSGAKPHLPNFLLCVYRGNRRNICHVSVAHGAVGRGRSRHLARPGGSRRLSVRTKRPMTPTFGPTPSRNAGSAPRMSFGLRRIRCGSAPLPHNPSSYIYRRHLWLPCMQSPLYFSPAACGGEGLCADGVAIVDVVSTTRA